MSWTPFAGFALIGIAAVAAQSSPPGIEISPDAARQQVAIAIDGKPFTTYRYGPAFPDKPVFYPVLGPNGARVNREFPMVKDVPGESNDHPHHQSLFFTYDEVNGTNFWNPEPTGRRIVHRDLRVEGSTLTAVLEWRDNGGGLVFEETKRVTFGGARDVFWMDHDITLRAPDVAVTMGDTKEGAFGLRLNDTLKEAGGTGRYIDAEGRETAANVWGKTSRWVAIRGTVRDQAGSHDVTVAIFAHPSTINAPPYWHARDYGLFAMNPFSRNGYDPSQPKRITTVAKGGAIHVRARLAVYAGQVDKARLDRDAASAAAAR
ncbi:MAG: PmoA family protein [Acidobacteria bacterium]|nr:PmoA family protein [Acidobacteriota bacterium]